MQENKAVPYQQNPEISGFFQAGIRKFGAKVGVCAVASGTLFFIKFNNPCIFEGVKFWYQNNVCEEKYTAREIKDKTTFWMQKFSSDIKKRAEKLKSEKISQW